MTARYLYPDHRALTDAGARFGAWWSRSGHEKGPGEDDEGAEEMA
jgi:hypothetical protein